MSSSQSPQSLEEVIKSLEEYVQKDSSEDNRPATRYLSPRPSSRQRTVYPKESVPDRIENIISQTLQTQDTVPPEKPPVNATFTALEGTPRPMHKPAVSISADLSNTSDLGQSLRSSINNQSVFSDLHNNSLDKSADLKGDNDSILDDEEKDRLYWEGMSRDPGGQPDIDNRLYRSGDSTIVEPTPLTISLSDWNGNDSIDKTILVRELNKLEDLLAHARAERDEMVIKYNALAEQKCRCTQDNGDIPNENDKNSSSYQLTLFLRRKLDEEHSLYKQKLQIYQDGQQRQAQLVQKLQTKIIQYKKKLTDLESEFSQLKSKNAVLEARNDNLAMHQQSGSSVPPDSSEDNSDNKLEDLYLKLQQELLKNESYAHVNNILREQLDQLSEKVATLTHELKISQQQCQDSREELEMKNTLLKQDGAAGQNRQTCLVSVWRMVVDLKRNFSEMKLQAEQDIRQARTEMDRLVQQWHWVCVNACSNLESADTNHSLQMDRLAAVNRELQDQLKTASSDGEKVREKSLSTNRELSQKLEEVTQSNKRLRAQLEEKCRLVTSLQRVLGTDSTENSEQSIVGATEQVHQALREITQALILDSDSPYSKDSIGESLIAPQHSALQYSSPDSSQTSLPNATPLKRSLSLKLLYPSSHSDGAFANSTSSAVQSILSKKNYQIQDLENKLNSNKSSLQSLKQQVNDHSAEKRKLEQMAEDLQSELDKTKRERDELSRNCDRLRHSVNGTTNEKSHLERQRTTLTEQLDNLRSEFDKSQASNRQLDLLRERLEDHKQDLQSQIDRMVNEKDRMKKAANSLEERITQLKEELATNKKGLQNVILERDVLEHEKQEMGDSLNKSQTRQTELESEINKLKGERSNLQDTIVKLEAEKDALLAEKAELSNLLDQYDRQITQLSAEKHASDMDKQAIKEELSRMEQQNIQLDKEKSGLHHSYELAELTRERLQQDSNNLLHEKLGLTEQLAAVRRSLNACKEEVASLKRENERVNKLFSRVEKDKGELIKEKGELLTQLSSNEEELLNQSNYLCKVRSEKEEFETNLYQSQKQIQQLEANKNQLELALKELESEKESLKERLARQCHDFEVEIDKLMRQKELLLEEARQRFQELQNRFCAERESHEEAINQSVEKSKRDVNEKEEEMNSLMKSFMEEKEEIITNVNREKEKLNTRISHLMREQDDILLLAEKDKQESLNWLEQEKSALQERLNAKEDLLVQARSEFEKLRQEMDSRHGRDREMLKETNSELKVLKEKFEETCNSHLCEMKSLKNEMNELQSQRDHCKIEIKDLDTKRKLAEESRDNFKKEFAEVNQKIKNMEDNLEFQGKDLMDYRRWLQEEQCEKTAIESANQQFRQKIKENEFEKVELNRALAAANARASAIEDQNTAIVKEAGEIRSNLRQVEKLRLESRKELQDLQAKFVKLENEKGGLVRELVELKSRYNKGEAKEEESFKDTLLLKQRICEIEASREALSKELTACQRKLSERDELLRLKERELTSQAEDNKKRYKKLDDSKKMLESQMERYQDQITELKTELTFVEGRSTQLEHQLRQMSQNKKEAHDKLNGIQSVLRRLIGYRPESQTRSTNIHRQRSASGMAYKRSRSVSPNKMNNQESDDSIVKSHTPEQSFRHQNAGNRSFSNLSVANYFDSDNNGAAPSPAVDIDAESVRLALRDFIQQLVSVERERDEALSKSQTHERKTEELTERVKQYENRIETFQKAYYELESAKRFVDERITSLQTSLDEQEDANRKYKKQSQILSDKVNTLENEIAAYHKERKKMEDYFGKQRHETEQIDGEKRKYRKALEEAENHCTQIELARRTLEGDCQRLKLAKTDKEAENSMLQNRLHHLQKQIQDLESKNQSLQLTLDRHIYTISKAEESDNCQKEAMQQMTQTLAEQNSVVQNLQERLESMQHMVSTAEQDKRMLQERLDSCRQSLQESKNKCHQLMEKNQTLQADVSDNHFKRSELESQMKQANNSLNQKFEQEQEYRQKLQQLTADKSNLQNELHATQKAYKEAEAEKLSLDRSAIRLEKEKNALKKTLEKVKKRNSSILPINETNRDSLTQSESKHSTRSNLFTLTPRSNLSLEDNHQGVTPRDTNCQSGDTDRYLSKQKESLHSFDVTNKSNTALVTSLPQKDLSNSKENHLYPWKAESEKFQIKHVSSQRQFDQIRLHVCPPYQPDKYQENVSHKRYHRSHSPARRLYSCKNNHNEESAALCTNNNSLVLPISSSDHSDCSSDLSGDLQCFTHEVERERLKYEDILVHQERDYDNIEHALRRSDLHNSDLQRELQILQSQMVDQQYLHAHQLEEAMSQEQAPIAVELERLKNNQIQMEQVSLEKEKAYRQRVQGLEKQNELYQQQIGSLSDQLHSSIQKKEPSANILLSPLTSTPASLTVNSSWLNKNNNNPEMGSLFDSGISAQHYQSIPRSLNGFDSNIGNSRPTRLSRHKSPSPSRRPGDFPVAMRSSSPQRVSLRQNGATSMRKTSRSVTNLTAPSPTRVSRFHGVRQSTPSATFSHSVDRSNH